MTQTIRVVSWDGPVDMVQIRLSRDQHKDEDVVVVDVTRFNAVYDPTRPRWADEPAENDAGPDGPEADVWGLDRVKALKEERLDDCLAY